MNILLCSKNESLLRRWKEALNPAFQTYQAASIDSARRIINKVEINLTFLHRNLADDRQIEGLISHRPNGKVFILADRPDNNEGVTCLKLGCAGYSNAYIAPARLVLAAQAVNSGLVWTGSSLMQHLIRRISELSPSNEEKRSSGGADVLEKLSRREFQVAALVAEGLTNREIADQLAITERTVKAHLGSIYTKTATSSRIGLARLIGRPAGIE